MANKKQQTAILALIAVVFLGSTYYLYTLVKEAGDMWPYQNASGSITRRINNVQQTINKLRQDVAKIEPVREELEQKKEEYALATRVLPRESTPDQLIAAIRIKAQQSGVFLTRLQPKVAAGSRRGGPFEEWEFSLQLRGSYDQIATFVNRMEEFDSNDPGRVGSEKRFFKLSSINITADSNGLGFTKGAPLAGADGHNCTLTMQTYRFTGEE